MRTYDPLSVDELGKNAARALREHPSVSLPPDPFDGAGVYTLHYAGAFQPYSGMDDVAEAIYVGKASPPGGRQGRDASASPGKTLHARLSKHARSIDAVQNLDLADFRCRWLVLDPVWTGLTEQVLITEYRPIWNVVVAGFGINAPGRGRGRQTRSQWDTVHPGRPEVAALPDREETVDEILESIAAHRLANAQMGGPN